MAFKIYSSLKVLEVAKSQETLDGFKVQASKGGQSLEDTAASLGLKLEATDKALYFRCKMLGYDLPNGNGDAIPRVYASTFGPSFIGKQLNVNHEPTPEKIIGKILTTYHTEAPVVLSEKDERIIGRNVLNGLEDAEVNELQLEGICFIDRTTSLGDDLAKKLISGTVSMVSQEASTSHCLCSVCSHKVAGPFDSVCAHLDYGSIMVQAYAVEGKKNKILAYKIHQEPTGTGLAIVTVGAYSKADVLELVAKLESQTIKADDALGALELQARMYGESPLIAEARLSVTASMNKLNQASVLTAALKKLDGVETQALMAHFGKVKAEEEMKPLPQKASDTSEDVKTDPEAAPKAEDATMSVSTTETGEALGITKDTTPADMPAAIAEAEKEAKTYAKEAQEGGDAIEEGSSEPEAAAGASGGGAPKIAVSPKVSAMFFRQPVLSASYWTILDDGKVVTRVTLGALSGGDLTKKVRAGATAISLADHLSSESYAKDILAHVAKRGLTAVLSEFTAAEKAFKKREVFKPGDARRPKEGYGDTKRDKEHEAATAKDTPSADGSTRGAFEKFVKKLQRTRDKDDTAEGSYNKGWVEGSARSAEQLLAHIGEFENADDKKIQRMLASELRSAEQSAKSAGGSGYDAGYTEGWRHELSKFMESLGGIKADQESEEKYDKGTKSYNSWLSRAKKKLAEKQAASEAVDNVAKSIDQRKLGKVMEKQMKRKVKASGRIDHSNFGPGQTWWGVAVSDPTNDADLQDLETVAEFATAQEAIAYYKQHASSGDTIDKWEKGKDGLPVVIKTYEGYSEIPAEELNASARRSVRRLKAELPEAEASSEGAAPVTVTSYDSVVTEESSEEGDIDHELSDGPEDGDVTTFDESDLDEDGSFSAAVAQYLKRKGVSEASSSDFHPGVWYETEADEDYKSGNYTTTSYHIKGLSDEQQQEVFNMLGFGPKIKGAVPAKFWKGKNVPSNNPAEPPLSSAAQVVPDSPGVTRTHGTLKPGGAFLTARKKK